MSANGTELLGRCERIVERALARGADQAEAYWEAGASMDVDVEAGRLAGTSMQQSQGGAVRVVVAGRVGFAYLSRFDDHGKAIDDAVRQAATGPGKGYSLPAGSVVEPLPGRWDDSIAAMEPEPAAALAKELIAGCKEACPAGNMTGGGVGSGWHVEAIASSEGVAAWDRTTSIGAGASLVLEDGGGSISVWDSHSVHTGALDAHEIGRGTGATAMDLRKPADADGGTKDVILMPDAASELILGFVGGAVDGDEAKRGRSVWSDALGQPVAHDGLSITDSPRHPGGIGTCAMDGEGMAAQSTPILEAGHLRTFLFDSWTAHRHQTQTTGHAQRSGFKALPSTGGHHWVLEHATTKAHDPLLADVDDGYLVESVLGAHTANATTGDFSVTSPNVWRIRNGAVESASNEVAIAGNLPAMLKRLDAVSDAPKHRDGAIVPALRFRDVQVSV